MSRHRKPRPAHQGSSELRVIGGKLKGRRIAYSGDPTTRPMKDRVREAVFNLLGPDITGTLAIDPFAGTGAMAFEALSRGSSQAIAIEQHFPTVALIRRNAVALGMLDRITVHAGDAFYWVQRLELPRDAPLTVFCCPPYRLYQTRGSEMQGLIHSLFGRLTKGSRFVVEADEAFDLSILPTANNWLVRHYPPAVIAIYRTDAS